MDGDPEALVRGYARVAQVPFVPEIRLYQAAPTAGLWELSDGGYSSDRPPPFWAFAWAGGRALARYVLDHPDTVAGRSVLDLAAGSGLVAIAAARSGAREVRAVDIDPAAVAAIGLNAAENGVPVTAELADLLPGSATPAGAVLANVVPAADAPPSVVLAGDAFYSAAMAGRVLAFLRWSARGGARVLVGDADRGFLPRARFRPLARYEVPVSRALEGSEVQYATVWELWPAR